MKKTKQLKKVLVLLLCIVITLAHMTVTMFAVAPYDNHLSVAFDPIIPMATTTTPAALVIMSAASSGSFLAPIEPIPSDIIPANIVQISTPEQLATIGGAWSEGKYFILTNDINLVDEWVPIEDFRGTFDGRGFNINNLFVLESSYKFDAGLFGEIHSATIIKNVGINIGEYGVFSSSNAGGLVGITTPITIINCHVTGSVTSRGNAGGLVGRIYGSVSTTTISHCFAIKNNLDVGTITARNYTGGLIGSISQWDKGASITNSHASNDVVIAGETSLTYAGGLIGEIQNAHAPFDINNCFATGDVQGAAIAGGLIGYAGTPAFSVVSDINITNSYATGNVMAIYPMTSSPVRSIAGGLFGGSSSESRVNIVNSYAKGNVSTYMVSPGVTISEGGLAGGLVGNVVGINVVDSYRDVSQLIERFCNRLSYGITYLGGETNSLGDIMGGAVTSVTLNRNSTTIYIGNTQLLFATILPVFATNRAVTWSSSNPSVATVNNSGRVTAITEGTTTITVTTIDGGFTATCEVTVTERPPFIPSDIIVRHDGSFTSFNDPLDVYMSRTASTTYSQDLSKMAMALSWAAYNDNDIEQSLMSNRFTKVNIKPYQYREPVDGIKYTISTKTMPSGDTIVAIIIRGTIGLNEWGSNFNVSLTHRLFGNHVGFDNAKNHVFDNLKKDLGGLPTDGSVKYFITGHSRGAAVSNLLAGEMSNNGVRRSDMYVYTFAAPDVGVAMPHLWNDGGRHDNIFNICNRYDPVPKLPGALLSTVTLPGTQWGKYGRTYWHSESGLPIEAHKQPSYLKFVKGNSTPGSSRNFADDTHDGWYEFWGFWTLIMCPVDVVVVDNNGNTVAKITDNEPDYMNTAFGDVVMLVIDDTKSIFLRRGSGYRILLTATDNGTMDFIVSEVNLITDEIKGTSSFSDLNLVHDKKMQVSIGGSIDTSKAKLFVLDKNGNAVAEVLENGSEVPIKSGGNYTGVGGGSSSRSNSSALLRTAIVANTTPPATTEEYHAETPTPTPPPHSNPFTDVRETDWFYNDVLYAYANGLMIGTNTNPMMFSPNMQLTRGMLVTILHRMEGSPSVSGLENPFTDTAEGMWYTDAIKWAADNGLVVGYGNGRFGSEDNITRQDLAVILAKYADLIEKNLPPVRDYIRFNDEADTTNYAKEAIERFFRAGIISGRPHNLFDPKATATRAEVAAILHRFIELEN
jgi:hypothetical protein